MTKAGWRPGIEAGADAVFRSTLHSATYRACACMYPLCSGSFEAIYVYKFATKGNCLQSKKIVDYVVIKASDHCHGQSLRSCTRVLSVKVRLWILRWPPFKAAFHHVLIPVSMLCVMYVRGIGNTV